MNPGPPQAPRLPDGSPRSKQHQGQKRRFGSRLLVQRNSFPTFSCLLYVCLCSLPSPLLLLRLCRGGLLLFLLCFSFWSTKPFSLLQQQRLRRVEGLCGPRPTVRWACIPQGPECGPSLRLTRRHDTDVRSTPQQLISKVNRTVRERSWWRYCTRGAMPVSTAR